MARKRYDYVFGTTDAALTTGTTTLSSPDLARMPAVSAPDIIAVTLHDSTTGSYEIVHVTSKATLAATTATILRAQEGTTAQAWASGANWTHGLTVDDTEEFLAGGGGGTIPPGVGASAYRTTTQSCASGTVTMLSFDAESYDTDNFHSTTVNPARLTVPAGMGGLYRVTGRVAFAVGTSIGGQSTPILYKNGVLAYDVPWPPNTTTPSIDVDWNLAPGDYVELGFYHESAGAISTRTATYPVTFLSMILNGEF